MVRKITRNFKFALSNRLLIRGLLFENCKLAEEYSGD